MRTHKMTTALTSLLVTLAVAAGVAVGTPAASAREHPFGFEVPDELEIFEIDPEKDACRFQRTQGEAGDFGLHWNRDRSAFLPSLGRPRGYIIYYAGSDDDRFPRERTSLTTTTPSGVSVSDVIEDVDWSLYTIPKNYSQWSNDRFQPELWRVPFVVKSKRFTSAQIGGFTGTSSYRQVRDAATLAQGAFNPIDTDFLIVVPLRTEPSRGGSAMLHLDNYSINFGGNSNLHSMMVEASPGTSRSRLQYVAHHEFGHLLGLPDLYPETGNLIDQPNAPGSRFTANTLLMDGSLADGPSGYARWLLGWIPDKFVECVTLDDVIKSDGDRSGRGGLRFFLDRLDAPPPSNPMSRLLVVSYPAKNMGAVVEARARPSDVQSDVIKDPAVTSLSYDVNANATTARFAGALATRPRTVKDLAPIITARDACDLPQYDQNARNALYGGRLSPTFADEHMESLRQQAFTLQFAQGDVYTSSTPSVPSHLTFVDVQNLERGVLRTGFESPTAVRIFQGAWGVGCIPPNDVPRRFREFIDRDASVRGLYQRQQ